MNIEDFEFSDSTLSAYEDGEELQLDTGWDMVSFDKEDAIAIARYFKLTAIDIKP